MKNSKYFQEKDYTAVLRFQCTIAKGKRNESVDICKNLRVSTLKYIKQSMGWLFFI